MTIQFKRILPTPFELASLLLLAVALIGIGNTRQLLDYYGLDSSTTVIQNSAGSAINSGLSKLDAFSFTGRIVTFAIWSIIGVFCFSVVQAIGRVYRGLEEDEAISSNRYVHPRTFVRSAFWKQVIKDFTGLLVGLALLGSALYLFFAYSLPAALAYTRLFLLGVSASRIGAFVLGFGILYAWLIVLCGCIKLLVNRRQLLG